MGLVRYRWQKVVNELRFLYEELDLCEEICSDAGPLFQKHYEEICQQNNIAISPDGSPDTAAKKWKGGPRPPAGALAIIDKKEETFDETMAALSEPIDSEDDSGIHKVFHRLFKKIVMFLHPDKFPKDISVHEREKKTKMFNKAKKALEERYYFVLLDYAQRLEIEIPTNYNDQIRWMKTEAKAINHELSLKKMTYGYQYAMCETEEQKQRLVANFIKQTRGIEIT
jgi:hypothetical protein